MSLLCEITDTNTLVKLLAEANKFNGKLCKLKLEFMQTVVPYGCIIFTLNVTLNLLYKIMVRKYLYSSCVAFLNDCN